MRRLLCHARTLVWLTAAAALALRDGKPELARLLYQIALRMSGLRRPRFWHWVRK